MKLDEDSMRGSQITRSLRVFSHCDHGFLSLWPWFSLTMTMNLLRFLSGLVSWTFTPKHECIGMFFYSTTKQIFLGGKFAFFFLSLDMSICGGGSTPHPRDPATSRNRRVAISLTLFVAGVAHPATSETGVAIYCSDPVAGVAGPRHIVNRSGYILSICGGGSTPRHIVNRSGYMIAVIWSAGVCSTPTTMGRWTGVRLYILSSLWRWGSTPRRHLKPWGGYIFHHWCLRAFHPNEEKTGSRTRCSYSSECDV